jgi:hypothetical protein
MFYLQCEGRFDAVAKLAAVDADPEILSKARSEEARTARPAGKYAQVDGRLVCLFRRDGALWLRVDAVLTRIDDDVHALWSLGRAADGSPRAAFRLERAGESVLSFDYRPFGGMKIIPGDPTPFVTEEDYDFLLLVSRVVEDAGRRARFFADAPVV